MNKNWLRSKDVVFGFIILMMAYVLNHNERFVIQSNDPIWNHYQSFKWLLLPHALAGACALFLGRMQFSDRLRLRYTKLHRVMGRVYVPGVLIAALCEQHPAKRVLGGLTMLTRGRCDDLEIFRCIAE
ncbi:MAG TPA: DUF2306 domain-containing protein [Edaphobacter sp.]|nr:DUF2306 domain-containing protein [Edaphobacter sp.]